MGDIKMTIDTKAMRKFNATLAACGGVPKKVATKAAGKGATVVRRAIRGLVPVDTGSLKRGIVRVGERTKLKGKKVYQLTFDSGMNDIFQKPIKNQGEFGGKKPWAYYPASMEYGFLTRSKGGGYDYVPGYHFMREAAEASEAAAKQAMMETFTAEMVKEWTK